MKYYYQIIPYSFINTELYIWAEGQENNKVKVICPNFKTVTSDGLKLNEKALKDIITNKYQLENIIIEKVE